jgi:ABC-2 type transport system ATP-binding protein
VSAMVKCENLTKFYGFLPALRDLNLEIDRGDIMGFIGPNGAGKTTTIKICATLLQPTSGAAWIDGINVLESPQDVRRVLGYMPDFFGVYDDVKVWEYLDFFAAAHKIPKAKRKQTIDDVLELTDLTVKREDFVDALSRGMKQRLCLAKTLLHDPKVLLLDEPASGLDPRARIEIKELLKELKSMGKTILISSHILPELADFCNKVCIIEQGQMVVCGDVSAIVDQARGGRLIEIRFADRAEDAMALLRDREDVKDLSRDDGFVKVQYIGNPLEQHELLTALVSSGFKIQSFSEANVDLEDVFMKVTRGAVA